MKRSIMIAIITVLLFGSNAWATLYNGSVSNFGLNSASISAATLQGSGNAWGAASDTIRPRGLTLSWNVESVGSDWKYTYTLYGNVKATDKWVQTINLETPSGFLSTDIQNGWSLARSEAVSGVQPTPASDIRMVDVTSNATGPSSAAVITLSQLGSLNFLKPQTNDMTGIQWSIQNAPTNVVKDTAAEMFQLSFVSDYAPMWGDFAVIGSGGAACNLHYGSNPLNVMAVGDGNNGGWVLVPGMKAAPVPLPPAVFLFISGLGGVAFLRRKKFAFIAG